MAKPYHAKVLTMFERIMKEDNNTYKELFRPDAARILWFPALPNLEGGSSCCAGASSHRGLVLL